jgi:hypothetical protein
LEDDDFAGCEAFVRLGDVVVRDDVGVAGNAVEPRVDEGKVRDVDEVLDGAETVGLEVVGAGEEGLEALGVAFRERWWLVGWSSEGGSRSGRPARWL